jgi:hypothetical protein
MLTMPIKAVIQPAMVEMAARKPKRAAWLNTKSMLGLGVADTTKVISTKIHQVCSSIELIQKTVEKGPRL